MIAAVFTNIRFQIKQIAKRLVARPIYELIQAMVLPFQGEYATFEDAKKAAPQVRKIGYNNPEAAEMYLPDLRTIWPSDYPLIYWLEKALQPGSHLFDWGGNIGLSYYAFQRYITYPSDLDWLICDVPEVTRAGKGIAKRNNASGLRFTNQLEDCDGCDIFIASGALQYINTSLGSLLAGLRKRPGHVFINRTPVHQTRGFYTLQDIGPVICPYQIFAEGDFVNSIQSAGYELRDRWSAAELTMRISFHPEDTVKSYSGFYFKLRQ